MKNVNFTLLGNAISVNFEMTGNSQLSSYVLTDRFRPDEIKKATSDTQSQTLESEFVTDITFLINKINQMGSFNRDSLIAALKDSCKNHIQKFNRLIDTDLYTYIDCSMHILESTNRLSKADLKPVYIAYVNLLMGEFRDFIYIAKPPLGVIKLTDLMKQK